MCMVFCLLECLLTTGKPSACWDRKGCRIPWTWSYCGCEPESSGGAACAFICWATTHRGFVQVPAWTWVWGSFLENGQPTSGQWREASLRPLGAVSCWLLSFKWGSWVLELVFLMPKKITYLNFYFLVFFVSILHVYLQNYTNCKYIYMYIYCAVSLWSHSLTLITFYRSCAISSGHDQAMTYLNYFIILFYLLYCLTNEIVIALYF